MEGDFCMDSGINNEFNKLTEVQLNQITGGKRADYQAGVAYGRLVGGIAKWGWFVATHL